MGAKIVQVLLADDNKNEHVFFTHALKYVGFETALTSIYSSQQLLGHLAQEKLPDILFLDVNMPMKNGLECLSLLRADERYRDMPIIMYSTSDNRRDTDQSFLLGADLYIRKPVEIDELVAALAQVFQLYHSGQLQRISREAFVLSIP